MNNSYIIDGVRTPIGNFRGSLSAVRSDDLMAMVIRKLFEKHPEIPLDKMDDVILGCANQAGEDNRNIARMSALLAGLPWTVPGETVNRLCASGMSAIIHAHRAIHSGDGDLFVAGGVEHMTRAPWVMSKSSVPFGSDSKLYDSSFGWRFVNPMMKELYGTEAMGETAENLVDQYKISRKSQDRFAAWSQSKAGHAIASGRFQQEIMPVIIPQKKAEPLVFINDEFVKPNTSEKILSKLRPAFREGGSVTAGNSSGLNDGAAALIVASDKALHQYGLKPMARVVASAVAGVEPRIMGIGPVAATQKALLKAGLTLKDMQIIEINEAFSAQVLACLKAFGLKENDPRINPNGGAIALGHPLGMSGARLIQTAALELQLTGKRFALCTMCIGVGQGYAVILEAV